MTRRGAYWTVAAVAVSWFALNVYRATLPVLLPTFRELYGVQYGDAGVLFGVLFAGIALSQLPSGLLADQTGERAVLVVGLAGATATLALFSVARTLLVLVLVAFGFGLFTGSFRSVAISAVTKAVPADRAGSALGVMAAGNPLGNLVGPVVTALLLASLSVVATPLVLAASGVFAVAFLWWATAPATTEPTTEGDGAGEPTTVEPNGGTETTTEERLATVLSVLRSRQGVLIVVVSLAFSLTWQGMFSFLPSYLLDTKAVDLTVAGVLTGITFGTGFVFNLLAGHAADRVGRAKVMSVGLLGSALALFVLPATVGLGATLAVLVVFSASLSAITPARDAFISDLGDPADRASVVGGVRTTYILLASGGTVVMGAVIERAGFTAGIWFLAAVLLVGILAGVGLVYD